MANSFTSLFYHVVFSTKDRAPYIKPEIEKRVWSFIGGIARKHKMTAIQVGGIDDHIHALVLAPPTLAKSEIAQYLKDESSKWMHETFPNLSEFAWQKGYGAFTVNKAAVEGVVEYILNQREHHKTRTFQEEYLLLLEKHEISYDPRYLWG